MNHPQPLGIHAGFNLVTSVADVVFPFVGKMALLPQP